MTDDDARSAPPSVRLVDALADDPHGWEAQGVAALEAAAAQHTYGYDDLAPTAVEVAVSQQHQEYTTKRRVVAVEDGGEHAPDGPPRVVGSLLVALPRTSNTHLAEIELAVHPQHRGRGLGTALLARAEELAAAAGRTTVIGGAEFGADPADGEPTQEPTTGTGRAPAALPGLALGLARGYRLEQVERRSVLDLPLDPAALARHAADARAHAGADGSASAAYRLHRWEDDVPAPWRAAFGVLMTRMSTDVPLGGLAIEEDPWDAERVAVWGGQLREKDQGFLVAAAEHVPSGTLAAMTVLAYPRERAHVAYQEDTIVLREHRGRRLGMLVKAGNLEALGSARPGARRVHTWNAEENDHMLAINVALGFRPAGGYAALQKTLGPAHAATPGPATGAGA